MRPKNSYLSRRNERKVSSPVVDQGDEAPKGSFKKMPLLDADELRFFSLLSQAIDPSQAIFTKVPLDTIIHPQKPSEKAFLVFKEIDYLVCDVKSTLPICAIDIGQLESEVSYFLNSAGIPVVKLEGVISSTKLRQMIANAQPIGNMPFPQQIHDVEVTVIGVQLHPVPKKEYPKIILSVLEKPLRKKLVEYSLWGAMIIFMISAMYVVARVVWIYYTA